MSPLRRLILLLLLAAAAGAAITWFRQRSTSPAGTPEWPEFRPITPDHAATPTLHVVATSASAAWQPSDDNGDPPDGFPVKVKESSGIFHVPGGRFYDRTRADRCYPTASAAEADGYRRSKS